MTTRGLSWALKLDVVDEASRPLLNFARTTQRAERQTERAADAAKKAGVDLKDLGGSAKLTQAEFDKLTAAEKRAVVESTKLGTTYGKVALGAVQLEQKLDAAADAQKRLNDVSEDGERIGGKMKLGGAAAGVAAAGALSASFSQALDLEAGRSTLKAQLGLSKVDAKRAGSVAGALYSEAYGDSMEDVNGAIRAVGQNIGRIADTSKAALKSAGANTLNLQKAFGADAQETTRTVGQLVKNGMAKDVREAFDLITVGYQRGADKGGEFLDTLNEYSEPMKSLGLSARDFTGMLVEGAENGVYSVDKIGDAFKEFSIRAVDGSTTTRDAYKAIGLDADAYAAKIVKGGPAAKKATSEIMAAISGVRDPVKRETAGVALFGAMFEDLGSKAILGLAPARGELGKTAGAAKQLGDDLGDNSKAKITAFRREFEQGLAQVLADKVIPALEGSYEAAKPVLRILGQAADAAGKFGAEHPDLAKVAAGLVTVGIAAKGIKFASAITGVSGLLRGLGTLTGVGKRAGNNLGNALGDELADAASSSGRRGLTRNGAFTKGGVRGRMGSVGRSLGNWLGLSLGERAAEEAADALGKDGAITKGKGKGGGLLSRLKTVGTRLGGALGLAAGAAAAAGIAKLVGDALDRAILGKDNDGKKEARDRALDPLGSNSNPLAPLIDGGKSLFDRLRGRGRSGGILTQNGFQRVRRYRGGGLVPALVSSGEMIEHEGRTGIVPGPRVAADNVPMLLPEGATVWTGPSQEAMAAGVAVDPERQVPHFRYGGPVKRYAKGGIVEAAKAGRAAGWSGTKLVTGVAIAGPESGYKREAHLANSREDSRGFWQINTKAHAWARSLNLADPFVNARAAERVYRGAGNSWQPWAGYTGPDGRGSDGKWRSYIPEARRAVQQTRGSRASSSSATDDGSTGSARTPLDERSVTIRERVRLAASETRARDAMSAGLTAGLDRGASWTRAQARLLGNPYLATVRQELDDARGSFTRERQLTVREGGVSREAAGNGLVYPLARRGKVLGRPGQGTHNGVNGPRNWQSMRAIDLGVPIGTGVRAIASGTVTKAAGSWSGGKRQIDGYTATIKTNAPGKQWFYTHLAARSVKTGDRVTAGQTIGRSGAGNGVPHIHLASISGQTDRLVQTALSAAQVRKRARAARRTTSRASGASAPRRSPGATVMRPVTGPQTSGYGMQGGRMHKGIDYGVPVGTPVRSIHDGMVLAGIPDPGGWGTNTRVSHGGGLSSLYAHLSSVGVRVGQRVGRGQTIARSGNSGRSTGPHLHLETWRNGTAFNPASLIGQRLRGGGRVRRFANGGVVGTTASVSAPTGRVGTRVDAVLRSTTDRNLAVLDRTLANLAESRLIGLQRYLATRVNTGGDAQANARIAAALKQVSEQVGFRIARVAVASASRLEQVAGRVDSIGGDLVRRGIETDSIEGRETTIQGNVEGANAALAERYRLEQRRRDVLASTRGMTTEARRAALDPIEEALAAAKDAAAAYQSQFTEALEGLARDRPRLVAEENAARLDLRGSLAGLTSTRDDDRQVAADRLAEADRVYRQAQAMDQQRSTAGSRDWLQKAADSLDQAATSLRDLDESRRAETLDYDAAMAALTETDADDRAVTQRRIDDAERRLEEAKARGEEGRQDAIRAAGDLKANRDALQANTSAMEELVAQTNALVDLQRQTLEAAQRAEVGQRVSQADIVRGLSRILSGSVGSQLFNAGGTPAVAGRSLGGL